MSGLSAALIVGLLTVIVAKRRKQDEEDSPDVAAEDVATSAKRILGGKLEALMEEQQLFRNMDLRVADVAAALHTNTTYLSAYLNGVLNTTFPAFITGYRIRYAQELMRQDPMMRLPQVAEASGFTNERTFLRTFKAVCGVTPSEWKQEGK